jgi:hypothetical protein
MQGGGSKLLQHPQIVLEQRPDVWDVELDHGAAVEAEAKGEAAPLFGAMPTLRRTWGWIMPQPRISIQPAWEQVPQPDPLQNTQDMSTLAEGSVKGKKLGRMRILESAPKSLLMKCSRVARRWPRWIPLSTRKP